MDFFRNIFGFPSRRRNDFNNDEERFNRLWEEERGDNFEGFSPSDDHDWTGFNIFTNPLEMHRYFEQQMNEFMKQFQMEDHGFFGGFGPSGLPSIQEVPQENGQGASGHIRDQYFKPGYEKPSAKSSDSKMDTDLDEKFQMGDLDGVLRKKPDSVLPFQDRPAMHFSGQSVRYRSVRNPDGSVETEKIVTDSKGNEERTITRKFRDKEHTIVVKKDSEGREETTENIVNMDSNDPTQVWKNFDMGSEKHGGLSDWFSKFFK